jgi:hypothetical protein
MSGFAIVPLAEEVAAEVRSTLRTPGWGYPASVAVAAGYGPCRTCLRMFEIGAERCILFTHDAFAGVEPYPLPGPVFIHAARCEPYRDRSAFPDALRAIGLTLEAYRSGRELRAQERVADGRVEPAVERLLADPAVDYIHVRNTDVGCFLLQIDRPDVAQEGAR